MLLQSICKGIWFVYWTGRVKLWNSTTVFTLLQSILHKGILFVYWIGLLTLWNSTTDSILLHSMYKRICLGHAVTILNTWLCKFSLSFDFYIVRNVKQLGEHLKAEHLEKTKHFFCTQPAVRRLLTFKRTLKIINSLAQSGDCFLERTKIFPQI